MESDSDFLDDKFYLPDQEVVSKAETSQHTNKPSQNVGSNNSSTNVVSHSNSSKNANDSNHESIQDRTNHHKNDRSRSHYNPVSGRDLSLVDCNDSCKGYVHGHGNNGPDIFLIMVMGLVEIF